MTTYQAKLWIILGILFATAKSCTQIPVSANRERRDINVGSCTWVIDRKCPDENIGFYLFTRKNLKDRQYIHIDVNSKTSNISLSYFDRRHPVKIIIHGYNSDMFLQPLIGMKDEYLQRSDFNLIYVDWSDLAPSPCYLSAVHNIKHVGACIAQLVERILDLGTDDIHVIGFSLGAQVTNYIALNLKSFNIPRITGLDPAMPLFMTVAKDEKLDPSDADFVDVIHTNALLQGKIERCGHADFYMNGGVLQPGCFGAGSNPFACSHHRAPDYYGESIRSLSGFWGWSCRSYINYLIGLCPKSEQLFVAGEDCRPETRGMFLVTTNGVAPFATGRWTDLVAADIKRTKLVGFTRTGDPLQRQIDPWGKIDGHFNNLDHFPTPYSQDPNGLDWPYFDRLTDDDTSRLEGMNVERLCQLKHCIVGHDQHTRNSSPGLCPICKGNHSIFSCQRFRSANRAWRNGRRNGKKCLRKQTSECTQHRGCRVCNEDHHTFPHVNWSESHEINQRNFKI